MRTQRPYPAAIIDRRGAQRAQEGHPWVFDNEITDLRGDPEDGGLCDVLSPKGRYLGTGFYNSRSKLRVRLLSQNANDDFSPAFWRRRFQYAWEYRRTVLRGETDACRVIFGESDQLPGLTVDKFGDILVAQTLCLGMDRLKPLLFPLLAEVLEASGQPVRGIFTRDDARIRELEGLPQGKGWFPLPGKTPPEKTVTEIVENGVRYRVDFENGQKTGFFLDQRFNRAAAARLAQGRAVLDCFTHTGSFGLNCAKAGAKRVLSVDISESAIAQAEVNRALNGLEGAVEYQTANVFDLLPALPQGAFDYIILDPPAFTKSGKTVDGARRGYKEINYRAMRALPRGGYLATCSCSHFMTDVLFRQTLQSAARDAQVSLRLIEARQQAPDHPVLWNAPETDYLKFYLFQVI